MNCYLVQLLPVQRFIYGLGKHQIFSAVGNNKISIVNILSIKTI